MAKSYFEALWIEFFSFGVAMPEGLNFHNRRSSTYAVRNITKTCYFTGVYPLTLVPEDTKYILTAKDDYGSEKMDIYIKQCETAGKKVSVIDSLASPQMKLYIVE